MTAILVPVDGSESSQRAVEYVVGLIRNGARLEVELLNVQIPILSGDIRRFVSQATIDAYHKAEGEDALKPAKALLEKNGIPFKAAILVGHFAETIAEYASKHECAGIVMGTRGMGPLKNLVLGSVATQVIHAANVPVTLVK